MSLNAALLQANFVGDIIEEVDSSDRPIYMGFAEAGTKVTDPKWKIVKFTYTGAKESFDTMRHAEGSTDFNKIWDNRESYNY